MDKFLTSNSTAMRLARTIAQAILTQHSLTFDTFEMPSSEVILVYSEPFSK